MRVVDSFYDAPGSPLYVAAEATADPANPLRVRKASLRAGAAIPPREWLYGTILLRRFVTLLVSPGGVGKTAFTLGMAIACTQGRKMLGDWVHAPTSVLVCNLEDPEDEFDRRIAAALDRHHIKPEAVDGKLWVLTGRERQLRMASFGEGYGGFDICFPDQKAMIAFVREHGIGIVIVDPFVNSHDLEENDNGHMNAAMKAWAGVADATGCAILLVHHTRKGAVAGEADSARGGGSLVSAARVALTLAPMSADEAEEFGIQKAEKGRYIRLDNAKANMAPPAEKARWFKLDSVNLGNATEEYPHGDSVQAIIAWEPETVWKEMTPPVMAAILDAIAAGHQPGVLYAPSNRGSSNSRWVGNVVVQVTGCTEQQARGVLRVWFQNGILIETTYRDRERRKDVAGVEVDRSKAPC